MVSLHDAPPRGPIELFITYTVQSQNSVININNNSNEVNENIFWYVDYYKTFENLPTREILFYGTFLNKN